MLVRLKPASEAEGRRFNSCRARQIYQGLTLTRKPFCFMRPVIVTTLVTTHDNLKIIVCGVLAFLFSTPKCRELGAVLRHGLPQALVGTLGCP